MVAEERPLPSIENFIRGEVKVSKRGPHLEYVNANVIRWAIGFGALSWNAEPLLRQLPTGFWKVGPMAVRSAKTLFVDLRIH
jgi:hypothetical protein